MMDGSVAGGPTNLVGQLVSAEWGTDDRGGDCLLPADCLTTVATTTDGVERERERERESRARLHPVYSHAHPPRIIHYAPRVRPDARKHTHSHTHWHEHASVL
eukprot:GHVU01061223.1.p5 GENE.GHVU01061223.1~~GHVU01061223.1.p5  ORF type:complete len:103 (+),score=8.86 GHVU01061223.1:1129-1437(+)